VTDLVAGSVSYQKCWRRFSVALLALLCLGLQAPAQSRLPAPAPRDNRQTFDAQPNPIKYVVPKHLSLGKSVKGYDIMASIYGSGAKHVLVFGGIHGDEPHTTVLARALAVNINQNTLPPNVTLVIVPDVNPDGLMASTRVNANGVDINRNFPSKTWRAGYTEPRWNPGAQPSSEPETRAVLGLLERYPPHLVVTLHAAMGCVNWDGTSGGPFAQVMAAINGYPLCASLGYETPGSLGMLTGIDRQVPTVTIELRPKNASAAVQENLNALLTLLKHFAAQ
jgi:protein MpaA